MKKLTRNVIENARQRYLKYNVVAPQQFNLCYNIFHGWDCEFHSEETCWTDGFVTWTSGNVLEIFFSCDPDLIDLESWNTDWNDE